MIRRAHTERRVASSCAAWLDAANVQRIADQIASAGLQRKERQFFGIARQQGRERRIGLDPSVTESPDHIQARGDWRTMRLTEFADLFAIRRDRKADPQGGAL